MSQPLTEQTTFSLRGRQYSMRLNQAAIKRRMRAVLPRNYSVDAGFDASISGGVAAHCAPGTNSMQIGVNPKVPREPFQNDLESVRQAYAEILAHEFCHVTQYKDEWTWIESFTNNAGYFFDRSRRVATGFLLIHTIANYYLSPSLTYWAWQIAALSLYFLPYALYFYSPHEIEAREYAEAHAHEWLDVITIRST
jgi:hypothetical protein